MPASPAADAKVLHFHDVLLRQADLELLSPGEWLNDQIIAFYFEYIIKEQYTFLENSVALIPGAMSFLLLNCDPSDAAMIFEALQLHNKQLVVFAVNDNPDVEEAAGGSHWSCLAYHRPSNSFRHYDSCKPHNRHVARALAGAASPLVRVRHQAQTAGSTPDSSSYQIKPPPLVEVQATPQQQNAHDCGVYVLAVTRTLCEAIFQDSMLAEGGDQKAAAANSWEQQENKMLASITPEVAVRLRRQIADEICRLGAATNAVAAAAKDNTEQETRR